jgi:hypothetical protein
MLTTLWGGRPGRFFSFLSNNSAWKPVNLDLSLTFRNKSISTDAAPFRQMAMHRRTSTHVPTYLPKWIGTESFFKFHPMLQWGSDSCICRYVGTRQNKIQFVRQNKIAKKWFTSFDLKYPLNTSKIILRVKKTNNTKSRWPRENVCCTGR